MADTYSPIIAKEEIRRSFPFRHLTPEPGTALVLFRGGQPLVTLWPGNRLTSMELMWSNYKIVYKVDITEHWFGFDCNLPCRGDAFHFHAEARVIYLVDDPAIIVEYNVINAREVLRPMVIRTMRGISRNHDVEEIDAAERAITKAVEGEVYDVGFRVNRCIINLSLEEDARAYIRKLRQIEREKERERREAELERQRAELEIERMRIKMDFYGPLIKEGHWQLLALQLTNHPQDVVTVAQMLSQHRQAEMEHELKALEIMLDKDALQDFQIEEVGKSVLRYFVEGLGLESETKLLDSDERKKALSIEKEPIEPDIETVELEGDAEIEASYEEKKLSQQEPHSHFVGQFREKEGQLRTVPLLKSLPTSATQPITADNIEAQIPVNQVMVPRVNFALRVQGDDLSQMGITDGDVVLVRQRDLKNGDIAVIVLLDQGAEDEVVLRKVFFDKYRLYLTAEDPGSHPITFTKEEVKERVRIVGKVVGVIQGSDTGTNRIVSIQEVIKVPPVN